MLILTSPAKTLDTESGKNFPLTSEPNFKREALQLVRILKKKKIAELENKQESNDA